MIGAREKAAGEIRRLLEQIESAPAEVETWKALRVASLRYTAAGGRPLGLLARAGLWSRRPDARLREAVRLWAHSPGNVEWMMRAGKELKACGNAEGTERYEPVLEWIRQLARSSGL